jgi:hypothetical protein
MMTQDQAPGKPTDCALSRYIRAHIITRSLQEAFDRVTAKQARVAVQPCFPPCGLCYAGACAAATADETPALLRRQAD